MLDRWMIQSVKAFKEFNRTHIYTGYCSVCITMLYPNEQYFRGFDSTQLHTLTCSKWLLPVISNYKGDIMVCLLHKDGPIDVFSYNITYPGIPFNISGFNYKELSALSPIKIMTQIVRNHTLNNTYSGHYMLTGSMWATANREFLHVFYGGLLGVFFNPDIVRNIDVAKVKDAFIHLARTNYFLGAYQAQHVAEAFVHAQNHSVHTNDTSETQANTDWPSYLLPADDVFPSASNLNLLDLTIGTDIANKDVQFRHHGLFSLIFPYLYTDGRGHYDLDSNHDENLPEELGGKPAANRLATLKKYVKQLLLGQDRRFARSPTWIFFMYDLIEKKNIQSANRHTVSTRKNFTRDDVATSATEYNSSIASNVPHTLRSSYAYKRAHAQDLQCIFDNLGPPQIFLTFSCDDFSEEYYNACDKLRPWEDPVKFASFFKERFLRFNSNCIKGRFATIVGGIKDYCWVMELQERGSPHIHMVLWTKKTVEQLIEIENFMVTDIPDENDDLEFNRLVTRVQTHKCTDYCFKNDNRQCRFGFPKPTCNRTFVDTDNKVFVKRDAQSDYINQYNPFLLAAWQATMDIQICYDRKVEVYLSKYLSKSDTNVHIMSGTAAEHFASRKVGIVEAVYDLLGYHRQQNSREVLYIDTTMPHLEQRRQLKSLENLNRLDGDSTDIYTRTQVEKYFHRGPNVRNLNMKEYFTRYKLTMTLNEREESESPYTGIYDPRRTSNINMNLTVRIPELGFRIPKYTRDSKNYIFTARNKLPFIRFYNVNVSQGEAFYYQKIALYHVSSNFEDERNDMTWREFFHLLIEENELFRSRFSDNEIEEIIQAEEILDREVRQTFSGVEQSERDQMINYLATATQEQRQIFEAITSSPFGFHLIHGGAGVGKSQLLKMIYIGLKLLSFVPMKLAPTGVAAVTIDGQTIHRFLGITNRPNIVNPRRIKEYFADLDPHQHLALLIDEISMVSYYTLNTIHNSFVATTLQDRPFGNVLTVCFGDFGQLTPVPNPEEPINLLPFFHPLFKSCRTYPMNTFVRAEPDEMEYKQFLNDLRLMHFNRNVFQTITNRSFLDPPEHIMRVFISNEETEQYNTMRIRQVVGVSKYYISKDGSAGFKHSLAFNETHLKDTLILKVGVPVMLLHNLSVSEGWVNGTMAVVSELGQRTVKITRSDGASKVIHPITRYVYKSSISRTQLPLDVAFATTVHKVQSLTLDSIAICTRNDFPTAGQLYVAASRVRKLENLYFFPMIGEQLNIRTNLDCFQAIQFCERNVVRE